VGVLGGVSRSGEDDAEDQDDDDYVKFQFVMKRGEVKLGVTR